MARVAAPCCARVEMARGPTSSLRGGGPLKSLARLSAAVKASTRRLTAILAAQEKQEAQKKETESDELQRGSLRQGAVQSFKPGRLSARGGPVVEPRRRC